MRIIAGRLRGFSLRAVPGLKVRPSSDRVKESLFNILAPRIPGTRFLDLYAGTGSIGIEAISRGASEVCFVEQDRDALRCLLGNIQSCRLAEGYTVLKQPVAQALRYLELSGRVFDLVFLDPPYQADLYASTMELISGRMVAPDGWVIAEHGRRLALGERYGGFSRFRIRRIGDTVLSFFSFTENQEGD